MRQHVKGSCVDAVMFSRAFLISSGNNLVLYHLISSSHSLFSCFHGYFSLSVVIMQELRRRPRELKPLFQCLQKLLECDGFSF